jgi:hypothetical protein
MCATEKKGRGSHTPRQHEAKRGPVCALGSENAFMTFSRSSRFADARRNSYSALVSFTVWAVAQDHWWMDGKNQHSKKMLTTLEGPLAITRAAASNFSSVSLPVCGRRRVI